MRPHRLRFVHLLLAFLVCGCVTDGRPSDTTVSDEYWTGTRTERTEAIYACLEALGTWAIEKAFDPVTGGLNIVSHGVDTREALRAFSADLEACDRSLPAVRWPETDAEYAQWYQRWMARYECLESEGFPLEPRPSFETWLDEMRSGDGEADPLGLLTDDAPETWQQASRACPQDPDAFW